GIRDRNVTGVQTCALPISTDMTRPSDEAERGLELLADRKPTGWFVSVDEVAESEHWLMEIDSPALYLTFDLPDISVLKKAYALQIGRASCRERVCMWVEEV